jgi:solute carrier family 45 protein 1/2/4
MGVEINKMASGGSNGHAYNRLRGGSLELESPASPAQRLAHFPDETPASTGEGSGVYLGILNLYTTLPQFVGTFISWIVFSILEPGKSPELAKEAHSDEHHSTDVHHSTDKPNGIAVCLFIGALSAVVAAWATTRLRRIH